MPEWLKERGFDLEIVSYGKVAGQVIHTLGGIKGVHLLRKEVLLKTLDLMAHGLIEIEGTTAHGGTGKSRARTISYQALWALLLKTHDDDAT